MPNNTQVNTRVNRIKIGMTGEFFVLAQLFREGFEPAFTLGNAKGVDIYVSTRDDKPPYRIEVKTTTNKTAKSGIFGENVEWRMSKKHVEISSPYLFYCFVQLRDKSALPRFFLVPSIEVAKYVRAENLFWWEKRGKPVDEDYEMRMFRIAVGHDAHGLSAEKFEDAWNQLK